MCAPCFVSLHGLWGVYGIDFRIDTLVSSLYCVFPVASFFIFLFVIVFQILEIALHAVVAIGYLTTFSILNWRTCAELGYCKTVASTLFETFSTKPVLAAFVVVALSAASQFVDAGTRRRPTLRITIRRNNLQSATMQVCSSAQLFRVEQLWQRK